MMEFAALCLLNCPSCFVNMSLFVSRPPQYECRSGPNSVLVRRGQFGVPGASSLHRCWRDRGWSEPEKESVSQLLAGTEKVRKLTLKHWREQRVSVIPQQEQCVPLVCSSNTAAPRPPLTRLFMCFILFGCDGSFKVPSGGCRCRLIRGAVVM